MKILWLHNHYQAWGGESAAAEHEARLLAATPGVEVVQEAAHNDAISHMGWFDKLALPLRNAWSASSYRRIRELCREHRPDVVHAHNVWPLLSPSVFAAARAEGVPTVFTAHNFYLFCLNGVFFRDGAICTDCKGSLPWSGLAHRCYRGLTGSATRFVGTGLHRALRTFHRVDRILTPTEFARGQVLEQGFAPERVAAKWLSCADRGMSPLPATSPTEPPRFVVACRLVREKGVRILLEACARAQRPWRLLIAGDGPERAALAKLAASSGDRAQMLGQLTPDRLAETMRAATAIVCPSEWFETFGLTAIEAFSLGRPVIASAIGALAEVVDDASGIRVPPGNADAFARAMDALAADPARAQLLGNGARQRYLEHFTPQRDAERLLAVYRSVRRDGAARAFAQ